jgi:8-oxo-dGTP pyrophosphatase MutT (NUDIX family)
VTEPASPIPAATVIVLRDRDGAPPEVLMVERSRAMRFAGGALVFPGGRIDAGDYALAAELGLDAEDGSARIAAVREAIEEAGVALGLTPLPGGDLLARLRARLHAGETIGAALDAFGLALDPHALQPFARWLPTGMPHRVFDTMFYLARWHDDAPAPLVDATENTRLFWMTAADVLAEADAGRATIIFPTRRNLERLAQFSSHDDAVAHARAHPVRAITPWFEERDGTRWLCIPDDLGYPVTAEAAASVRRA